MDGEYTQNEEVGKQCKNCKSFQVAGDGESGKCFNHNVVAAGSRNVFSLKGE